MKNIFTSTDEARMRYERRAFSLLELLVVVSIMAILAAVAVPAIKALTQGNNQKQTRNMVSALIAGARAEALKRKGLVGVMFFEDFQNRNQVAMRLIYETQTDGGLTYFAPLSKIEFAPRGVRIGVLDDNTTWQIRTEAQTNTDKRSRVILFDGNGQMVLRNGLVSDLPAYVAASNYFYGAEVSYLGKNWRCISTSIITGQAPSAAAVPQRWVEQAWNLNATSTDLSAGISNPGIVIWDADSLANSGATDDASRGAWVLKNADVLFVNAYTGNLIDALR